MKRIAVVAHCHHQIVEPFAGGLEMHTQLLCKELVRLGHKVTLFAKQGSQSQGYSVRPMVPQAFAFQTKLDEAGWNQQDFELNALYRKALSVMDLAPYDAVINNSLHSVPMEKSYGVPSLNVLHTPPHPALEEAARRVARDPMKAFISVSASNARRWNDAVGPARVVLNGIDLDRWRTNAPKTDELRWSARITPEKGLHEAIHAARLSGRVLRIAGPVSDIEYFDALIRPELDESVSYEGHLSHAELPEFYGSGAVAVVSPLWPEPFGLVVAEASACGTPVAAYARGAMAELVTSSIGAVASENTPAALAAAIERAAATNIEDCQRDSRSRFSAGRMTANYLATLDELVAENEPKVDQCAG